MSTKNDKSFSETLVAFNNHIVAIKGIVKKAKVNEIRKLIRKIKQLLKKKGNEVQLEKNKRKSEHYQEEIKMIKKLKFNEVAIFSFENDGVEFEKYVKANKPFNLEKISLARISLNKLVVDAVNKIKSDEKVGSWKKTFIQYKSRCEKRKSWKEKTKMLKEIEQNLKLDSNELEKLNEELSEDKLLDHISTDEYEDDDDDKEEDDSHEDETQQETKEKKVQKSNKSEAKTARVETKATKPQIKEKEKINNKLELSEESDDDKEILNNLESDDGEDEESFNESLNEEESTENESDSEEKFVYSSKNLENKYKQEEKSKFKPLVIENKPAHMVIKQICLDELKDVDEIPIQHKESIVLPTDSQNDDSNDESNQIETIKIDEDPFFLDKKGNEIINQKFDRQIQEALNDRSRRFSHYTKQDNLNSYSSYDNYRKRRNDSTTNFMNDRFDRFDNKPFRPYSSHNDKSDYNKRDSQGYDNKRTFSNYQSHKSFANTSTSIKQPVEDVSKLHPSWQAKRIQEQKLKELKFEGKKITFDD